MKIFAKKALIWIFNGILFLFCLYLLWGWLTVSDIKAEAQKRGYDVNKVMDDMTPVADDISWEKNASTTNVSVKPGQIKSEFRRFNFGGHFVELSGDGNIEVQRIHFLNPFTMFSEGVLNCLFSFAAGFMMSFAIVLLKLLKKGDVPDRYLTLRGFVGGMVSACLFVVVYSGGHLFWQNGSEVNGLSVGVIAAFGTIWCEKFEKVLSSSLNLGVEIEKRENVSEKS